MKKLIYILAVLLMAAGTAVAEIDVVSNGQIQSPWVPGPEYPYEVGGERWYNWLFASTHPVDGLPTARSQGSTIKGIRTPGATVSPDYSAPATLNLAGNRYLELDAYFYTGNSNLGGGTTYRTGTRFNTLYMQVGNQQLGGEVTWSSDVNMWFDGVHYTDMNAWAATADTWVHIKIDIGDKVDVLNDLVGVMRFNMPTSADFHVRDMAFTPEPAKIALLGIGGLALIRRKR